MSKFTVKWQYDDNGVSKERILDADEVHCAYDNRTPDRPANVEMLGIYAVPASGIVVIGNPYDGSESIALTFGKV